MLSEKSSPFPLRLPSPPRQPPQSNERPPPAPQSHEPLSDEEYEESSDSEATPVKKQKVSPPPQPPQSDERSPPEPQSHEPLSDEEYEESSDSEATPVKKQKVKPTLPPGAMFLEDALRPIEKFLKDSLRPGQFLPDPGYFFSGFGGADEVGDVDSWERYWDQIEESEGFDVKKVPGSAPMATIFPMPYYLDEPENVQELEGFAAKALEEYNEKHGTKYEVKEILKVNVAGCQDSIFYLTLSVKNDKEEYFQVKVVQHMDQSLEFPIVRPRVKGGSDI